MSQGENAGLVRLLRAVQQYDRELQIRDGLLRKGEEYCGYLARTRTRGCEDRAFDSGDHSFNLIDAIYLPTGESRVLKFPNPYAFVGNKSLGKQIEHEQNILSLLHHPNIVREYGIIQKGIVPYLAMEHLEYEACDVLGLVKDQNEAVIAFAFLTTKILMELQRRKVIHGDIKPTQFMATPKPANPAFYTIKLCDFTGATHPDLKTSSRYCTEEFSAPEVIDCVDNLSHAADIYSLGATWAATAIQPHLDEELAIKLCETERLRIDVVIDALFEKQIPVWFSQLIVDMTNEMPDLRPDAFEVMGRLMINSAETPDKQPGAPKKKHGKKPRPLAIWHPDLYTKEIREVKLESALGGSDIVYGYEPMNEPEIEAVHDADDVTEDELELALRVLRMQTGGNF